MTDAEVSQVEPLNRQQRRAMESGGPKEVAATDLLQQVLAENNELKRQIVELTAQKDGALSMINKHPQAIYELEVQLAYAKSQLSEANAKLENTDGEN